MDYFAEPEKKLPIIAKPDVVVAGGGVAGIAAAIASARNGAETVLIERSNALGGIGSNGMVSVWYYPRKVYKGILKEMAERLESLNALFPIPGGMTYDSESYKEVIFDMCEDSGVKTLLYSWVTCPIVKDGSIKGLVLENVQGRQAIITNFVVDSTGEASLAVMAGASSKKGRDTDGKLRYVTVMAKIGNVNILDFENYVQAHKNQVGCPPFDYIDIENKAISLNGFWDVFGEAIDKGELDPSVAYARFEGPLHLPNTTVISNTSRIYDIDGTYPDDLTRAEMVGRKQISQYLRVLRDKVPGFESAVVVATSSTLGIRRTRRVIGEYYLTETDFSKDFADTVVRLTVFFSGTDTHDPDNPKNDLEELRNPRPKKKMTVNIPYRCLVPKGIDGLLTAGRCISVNHITDFYTGSLVSSIGTGQAAGTAAALSMKMNIAPRELDTSILIDKLENQGPLDFRY